MYIVENQKQTQDRIDIHKIIQRKQGTITGVTATKNLERRKKVSVSTTYLVLSLGVSSCLLSYSALPPKCYVMVQDKMDVASGSTYHPPLSLLLLDRKGDVA